MIKVTAIFKSFIVEKISNKKIELEIKDGSTVEDMVLKLINILGKEIKPYLINNDTGSLSVIFIINGKQCTKNKILNDSDVITILPYMTGG